MSAIDLLLRSAIEYELPHQLALHALFENTGLSQALFRFPKPSKVTFEPHRGLFDLELASPTDRFLIELKVGDFLSDTQIDRQCDFTKKHGLRGAYVLLGTSWFEYDRETIAERTQKRFQRIGYEELLAALDQVLATTPSGGDASDLAKSYRSALQGQYDRLVHAAEDKSSHPKLKYYSVYWAIKQKLPSITTYIYPVSHPGGEVYLLTDGDWQHFVHRGVNADLDAELVNGQLCIKFNAHTKDNDKKLAIRDRLRRIIHEKLGNRCELLDAGRIGGAMTACKVTHDFADLSQLDRSVAIFTDVHARLPKIAAAI